MPPASSVYHQRSNGGSARSSASELRPIEIDLTETLHSTLDDEAMPTIYPQEARIAAMTTEQELRQKLRKIAALFEGATTVGERDAAAEALNRIRAALIAAEETERAIEMSFRLPDRWNRRLFLALCRRYGLRPYRYPRQRYSTVVLRAPRSFINETLWPEYKEISQALEDYLHEATERIIREEVFGDADEAEEKIGIPPTQESVGGFLLESKD